MAMVAAILLVALLHSNAAWATERRDSLVLKNKNVVVGEIKQMDKGVLTIKTAYSEKDFLVKWYGIAELYTQTQFLITLRDGRRFNGRIQSLPGTNRMAITTADSQTVVLTSQDLVFLKGLESNFWGRMKANIDIGLNLTKANNLRQFSMRSSFGYLANRWQLDGYFNSNYSAQDSVEDIKRTEGGLSYTYFMERDWYLLASLNTLSNTEQALKLRTTSKFGVGKFLLHTNKKYWGTGLGLSLLNETFFNETESRQSAEAYLGSELNLFNIGDLSLLSSVYVYKGLTEKERWRCDFKLDAKYDLPKDFYLKPGVTINYDNRPGAVGKELDYVFVFNIGWEFK
ncbi:MAG: DUF481 domain-containing protein [Chitinophagaceae bacterium]|nr:DUF481 domain-containing protein [Chitinophagaceae bacterium]